MRKSISKRRALMTAMSVLVVATLSVSAIGVASADEVDTAATDSSSTETSFATEPISLIRSSAVDDEVGDVVQSADAFTDDSSEATGAEHSASAEGDETASSETDSSASETDQSSVDGAIESTSAYTVGSCQNQKIGTLSFASRFDLCATSLWTVNMFEKEKVVGTVAGRFSLIGTGTPKGARKVSFKLALDKIVATGTLAAAEISAVIPCSGNGCSTVKPTAKTVAGWKANQEASFSFTAPAGTGADKIAKAEFGLSIVASIAAGSGVANAGVSSFRCDQAVILKTAGCVFDDSVAVLSYSRSSAKHGVVAQHINDAQTNPAATFPRVAGKTIPGSPSSGVPLHRLIDSKKQAANHRAAVQTCVDQWGANYTAGNNDCDEYPFQSTAEGAAKGDKRYSARPLNLNQNRSAGGTLNAFYVANRIINGDAFGVTTTP